MIKAFFPKAKVEENPKFSAKLQTPSGSVNSDFLPIPPELWDFLVFQMTELRVDAPMAEAAPAKAESEVMQNRVQYTPSNLTYSINQRYSVKCIMPSGQVVHMVVRSTTTADQIERYLLQLAPNEKELRLHCDSQWFQRISDVEDLVRDGHDIYVTVPQVGGKPVIYLYPSKEQDVSVTLALASQWEMDVTYPVVPTTRDQVQGRQTVEWHVRAKPSGDLLVLESDTQCSYLFWEALWVSFRRHHLFITQR